MKLSKNIAELIIILICSYFIFQIECSENSNLLTYKNHNHNSNSNHSGNLNSVSVASAMAVSEKNALNGGIFMDSRNLKHRKIKTDVSAMYSISSENFEKSNANSEKMTSEIKANEKAFTKTNEKSAQDIVSIDKDSEIAKKSNIIQTAYQAYGQNYIPSMSKKIDLSNAGPVLMHSWVKYFKYSDEMLEEQKAKAKFTHNLPNKFFTNHEFVEQMKYHPGKDYSLKDSQGEYQYIKSNEFFYMVVYKNIVTLFSTKEETVNIFS